MNDIHSTLEENFYMLGGLRDTCCDVRFFNSVVLLSNLSFFRKNLVSREFDTMTSVGDLIASDIDECLDFLVENLSTDDIFKAIILTKWVISLHHMDNYYSNIISLFYDTLRNSIFNNSLDSFSRNVTSICSYNYKKIDICHEEIKVYKNSVVNKKR